MQHFVWTLDSLVKCLDRAVLRLGVTRDTSYNLDPHFTCCIDISTHSLPQPRMEEIPVQVSKVLHIRNLPDAVTENDLIFFGRAFGMVTNVLLLRAKNQAFLEMGDSTTAANMLAYYSTNPATIR